MGHATCAGRVAMQRDESAGGQSELTLDGQLQQHGTLRRQYRRRACDGGMTLGLRMTYGGGGGGVICARLSPPITLAVPINDGFDGRDGDKIGGPRMTSGPP